MIFKLTDPDETGVPTADVVKELPLPQPRWEPPPSNEVQDPTYNTGVIHEEPHQTILHIYEIVAKWNKSDGSRGNSVHYTCGHPRQVGFDDILARYDQAFVLGGLRKPEEHPELIIDFTVEVRLLMLETWYCTWFEHSQPDHGDTHDECRASFSRFVNRIRRFNARWQREHGDRFEPICLMGAEDHWRWHGKTREDAAPCDCADCKKIGVRRIGH